MLFSLPPTVKIVEEEEDEVPVERMDVALEDKALEEVALLVVVSRLRITKPSVFCFFVESNDLNTFFFGGMVLGVERLSSKFSLGVERRRRGGR